MNNLFTIGYANKEFDYFLEIISKYDINCIIDVRTQPYSAQFPTYNEANLKKKLNENGVYYMPFKDEFGARRTEDVYEKVKFYDGSEFEVVIFDKVFKLPKFQEGVERVEKGLKKGLNIAFLCSEKYPYDCHRGVMVAEYFYRKGYDIKHIVEINEIIMHNDVSKKIEEYFEKEKKRFERVNYDEIGKLMYFNNLFGNVRVNILVEQWYNFFKSYTPEKAYYLRNLCIGYRKGMEENE